MGLEKELSWWENTGKCLKRNMEGKETVRNLQGTGEGYFKELKSTLKGAVKETRILKRTTQFIASGFSIGFLVVVFSDQNNPVVFSKLGFSVATLNCIPDSKLV